MLESCLKEEWKAVLYPRMCINQEEVFAQEIYEAKSIKLDLVKRAISGLLQIVSLLMPGLRDVLRPGITSSDDEPEKVHPASEISSDAEVLVGVFVGKSTAGKSEKEQDFSLPSASIFSTASFTCHVLALRGGHGRFSLKDRAINTTQLSV